MAKFPPSATDTKMKLPVDYQSAANASADGKPRLVWVILDGAIRVDLLHH